MDSARSIVNKTSIRESGDARAIMTIDIASGTLPFAGALIVIGKEREVE